MAGTIAEMLVGSALQSSQQDPQLEQIAGIASNIANIKAQRQQVELKKQEIQMQKANSVTDTIKIAAEAKDPKLKNFLLKNVMPSKIKALGMEEFFTPQTMEMIQTSDDIQRKVLGLQLDLDQKVRSGEMTGAEAYKTAQSLLSDPEQLALLDTDQIFEAQKFAASEEGKSYRAKQLAGFRVGAAGETEVSKSLGKRYADYTAAGGRANIEKNFKRLEGVLKDLKSGNLETGTIPGIVLSDPKKLAAVSPRLKAAMDAVQSTVQLKRALDSQFSQAEAAAVMARAFDPALPTEENIKKLETEIETLQNDVSSAEDEFKAQGFKVRKSGVNGPTNGDGETVKINGQAIPVMTLRDGYKRAKDKKKFAAEMAQAMGVSEAEALKLLEGSK